MKLLVGGRQSGKTSKLLNEVVRFGPGAVIVVASQQEAQFIWTMIQDRRLPIARQQIITPMQSRERLMGTFRENTRLFVDNAEAILSGLLGYPLEAVTMTSGVHGRLRVIEVSE